MNTSGLHIKDYLRSFLGIITFFIVFLIATPFLLLLLILSFGRTTNFIVERIAPFMMKPVFAVLGIQFHIKQHGKPVRQPAVYIINHSSTLDLLTILALGLPHIRFVAKWELQYNPIFFLLGRLTGQVFIQRRDSEQAVATLQKAYVRIKKNKLSVLLAPEGSRKHPGVIGPFKKGPFRMAMDLNYPIVPIYFEGNRDLSAGSSMLARPGIATAHIHPPVHLSDWTLDNLEKHILEIRHRYLNWAGVTNDPVAEISPDKYQAPSNT